MKVVYATLFKGKKVRNKKQGARNKELILKVDSWQMTVDKKTLYKLCYEIIAG